MREDRGSTRLQKYELHRMVEHLV